MRSVGVNILFIFKLHCIAKGMIFLVETLFLIKMVN